VERRIFFIIFLTLHASPLWPDPECSALRPICGETHFFYYISNTACLTPLHKYPPQSGKLLLAMKIMQFLRTATSHTQGREDKDTMDKLYHCFANPNDGIFTSKQDMNANLKVAKVFSMFGTKGLLPIISTSNIKDRNKLTNWLCTATPENLEKCITYYQNKEDCEARPLEFLAPRVQRGLPLIGQGQGDVTYRRPTNFLATLKGQGYELPSHDWQHLLVENEILFHSGLPNPDKPFSTDSDGNLVLHDDGDEHTQSQHMILQPFATDIQGNNNLVSAFFCVCVTTTAAIARIQTCMLNAAHSALQSCALRHACSLIAHPLLHAQGLKLAVGSQPIPKNTKIMIMGGEVVSKKKYNDMRQSTHSLNFMDLGDDRFIYNGEHGSYASLVNHNCNEHNTMFVMEEWGSFSGKEVERVPVAVLVAAKEINAGDELLAQYGAAAFRVEGCNCNNCSHQSAVPSKLAVRTCTLCKRSLTTQVDNAVLDNDAFCKGCKELNLTQQDVLAFKTGKKTFNNRARKPLVDDVYQQLPQVSLFEEIGNGSSTPPPDGIGLLVNAANAVPLEPAAVHVPSEQHHDDDAAASDGSAGAGAGDGGGGGGGGGGDVAGAGGAGDGASDIV
jgi:hypothetical protein